MPVSFTRLYDVTFGSESTKSRARRLDFEELHKLHTMYDLVMLNITSSWQFPYTYFVMLNITSSWQFPYTYFVMLNITSSLARMRNFRVSHRCFLGSKSYGIFHYAVGCFPTFRQNAVTFSPKVKRSKTDGDTTNILHPVIVVVIVFVF